MPLTTFCRSCYDQFASNWRSRFGSRNLSEGVFLVTSEELPGLIAQGRTVAEALDIARDVARKLIEASREQQDCPNLPTTSERSDYTIVVAA